MLLFLCNHNYLGLSFDDQVKTNYYYLNFTPKTRIMKNILIVLSFLMLIVGCNSKRQIVLSAEKYLKNHIGNPESYKRIEWKIIDTIYNNESLISKYDDSLKKSTSELQESYIRLKKSSFDISDVKSDFNFVPVKSKFGKYTLGRRIFIRNNKEVSAEEELSYAIQDSINISKSIDKLQNELSRKQLIFDELKLNIKNSDIDYINLQIRFRAELASTPQLTYLCRLKYNIPEKTFETKELEYDGIERYY